MNKTIHIGTSGWSYMHWKENFYPEDLSSKKWLSFYSENFTTVEINNTFYRVPRETTVKNWVKTVPSDFLFSVKASRYITHQKRLHDCKESLEYFFSVIKHFQGKLGPILFQLPPSFKMNKERLIDFITLLEPKMQIVFEFRHESWFVEEIYDLLRENNIALCITDLGGHQSPEVLTADFTYLRLHGPKKAYQGTYGKKGIDDWRRKIVRWKKTASVYCYFDNDEKGFAIQDAKSLQDSL